MSKIIQKTLNISLATVLAMLVLLYIDVNVAHYCTQMDADIASEAVLASDIAGSGFLVPDTWVSSTEDRVISTPNLAALLYPIVGNNMNLAMGISCSIMMVILLAVMAVYFVQAGFELREISLIFVILLAVSDINTENQSILFLWACYYVSNFISLFINLIIYNSLIKNKKIQIIPLILSVVLALLNGLQGMRGCLYCYFPLVAMEIVRAFVFFINKRKYEKLALIWLAALAVINYAVAKVAGPDALGASRNIRHAGEKFISEVVPSLNSVINYRLVPVLVVITCILAVVGYCLTLKKLACEIRNYDDCESGNRQGILGTFAPVASLLICILSTTFTTVEVAPRYFITELFIVSIGMALFSRVFGEKIKVIVAACALIIGLFSLRYYYDGLIKGDNSRNTDESKVSVWMQENGYEYGYATFDYANSITTYSNNSVKVRSVNSMSEMEGCKWLSDSRWYPPTKSSDGECCYIATEYSESDLKTFIDKNNVQVVDEEEIGIFRVFVFDHDYTVWER